MTADSPLDFIEVIHNAIPAESCAAILARMRTSAQLKPGEVGSGIYPELKHSKDLRISGDPAWAQVEMQLQQAVFVGVMSYLRRYPQALISPLMLQVHDSAGQPRRLAAEDFATMDADTLSNLARTCLRPGAINLQWYAAGEGGYPYWHCELYRATPQPKRCTATCCGRCISTTTSSRAKPSSCSRAARSRRVPAAC